MSAPCFNGLTIEGDPVRVQEVAASLRGEYSDGAVCLFAFNNVLPEPPDAPSSWLEDNWGTCRYPIYCTIDSDGSDGEFLMHFQSFNLAPSGVVATLAARNPDLHFELDWDTPDWSLGGRYVFAEGVLVADEGWEHEDELEEELEDEDVAETDDEPTPLAPIGRRLRRSSLAADADEQP